MTLPLLDCQVLSEWVDYNGHMNDAYYGVAFSRATDSLMDRIGLDAAERARSRHTIYTLAAMTRFLREAKLGEALSITAQLLDHDAKKMVVFLEMRRGSDVLATSEQLLLCVDQGGPEPRSAPFPPLTAQAVAALAAAHADLPRPEGAGQGISLRR